MTWDIDLTETCHIEVYHPENGRVWAFIFWEDERTFAVGESAAEAIRLAYSNRSNLWLGEQPLLPDNVIQAERLL